MESRIGRIIGVVAGVVTIIVAAAGAIKTYIDLTSEIERLEQELANRDQVVESGVSISAEELGMISDDYFSSDFLKDTLISKIRYVVGEAELMASYQDNFSFKLFRLEVLMSQYGGNINTHLPADDGNRRDAYKQIQAVLQDVGFYNGAIDGDQNRTNTALEAFQTDYNKKLKEKVKVKEKEEVIEEEAVYDEKEEEKDDDVAFPPTSLGYFGYKTLETIRSTHRTQVN